MAHEHLKPIIQSVRALAARQRPRTGGEACQKFDFVALLAALERAERIEALLKRGTQAGISNYPNQFVHFSYEDGQEIAALSEPQ